jgi:hypothetical protein
MGSPSTACVTPPAETVEEKGRHAGADLVGLAIHRSAESGEAGFVLLGKGFAQPLEPMDGGGGHHVLVQDAGRAGLPPFSQCSHGRRDDVIAHLHERAPAGDELKQVPHQALGAAGHPGVEEGIGQPVPIAAIDPGGHEIFPVDRVGGAIDAQPLESVFVQERQHFPDPEFPVPSRRLQTFQTTGIRPSLDGGFVHAAETGHFPRRKYFVHFSPFPARAWKKVVPVLQ